jgi:hypothetical protein
MRIMIDDIDLKKNKHKLKRLPTKTYKAYLDTSTGIRINVFPKDLTTRAICFDMNKANSKRSHRIRIFDSKENCIFDSKSEEVQKLIEMSVMMCDKDRQFNLDFENNVFYYRDLNRNLEYIEIMIHKDELTAFE